jgi:predicted outer membrane protein
VPRRWDTGSVRLRRVALRVSGFLLVVVAGVLGTAQPGMATTAQADPDVSYLNAAHQVNLAIIQASRVAKANGGACVRRVAARLEADHRRLAAEELEAARQIGVGLIAIPSPAQRQQLRALAGKTETGGYDAAWLAFQRRQHHQMLTLTKGELTNGTRAAVRSVAMGSQAVIQMHLRMIEPTCKAGPDHPRVPTGDGGQMAEAEQRRVQAAFVLLGLGVLLLAGKPIRARRHLLGLSAVVIAIALAFGGPLGGAGSVSEAGPSAADGGGSAPEREAAIPPIRLALPGVANTSVVPVATGRDGQL